LQTTSQESGPQGSEAQEFKDPGELFKAFKKLDLSKEINRKLIRGLYLRKGFISDDDH
jgi:hypothetical protein